MPMGALDGALGIHALQAPKTQTQCLREVGGALRHAFRQYKQHNTFIHLQTASPPGASRKTELRAS